MRELLDIYNTARRNTSGAGLTEEITGQLLDRVLPAAYKPRPGERVPPYDLQTARQALNRIAARMNQDDSYDLQWWRIPDWAPANTRRLGGKIVVGILIGVLLRTAFGLRFGVVGGAIFGIFCGYLVSWSKSRAPMRVGKVRLRQAFTWQTLMFGLGFGVITGFIAGVAFGVAFGIAAGVLVMVVVGASIGLEDALTNRDNISSSSPITSWRSDLMYGIMAGLMVTVVGGTLIGVLYGIIIKTGFVTAVVAGVTIGIAAGFLEGPWDSATWVASLAFVQLTWRWHTPMQLMRFLDDARRRGVLRTVGPVYQFRHASVA